MEQQTALIDQARRLLLKQRFWRRAVWGVGLGLALAAVGIAVPKFVPVAQLQTLPAAQTYNLCWLVAAPLGGLLVATLLAWQQRPMRLEAAIEVDGRCRLNERLSSACSLPAPDRDTPWGQTLVRDAERAATGLEIRDHFPLGVSRRQTLALLPALLIVALWLFVDNRPLISPQDGTEITQATQAEIEEVRDELKAKLDEEIARAEEQGLKEAEEALREIAESLEARRDSGRNEREEALVRLNDAKQKLAERANTLGDADAMRRQLSQLQSPLEGPADDFEQALAEGDLKAAGEELQSLLEQLGEEGLTAEQQAELAAQLEAMEQQLAENASAERQQQEELQRQIAEAKQGGDLQKAGNLQQQLDDLERSNPQLEQLDQLASQLGRASESLDQAAQQNEGEARETSVAAAQEALDEAAAGLQQAESDLSELESLDGLEQQIADAKNRINEAGQPQTGQPGQQLAQSDSAQPSPTASQSAGESNSSGESPGQSAGQQAGQQPGTQPGQSAAGQSAAGQAGQAGSQAAQGAQAGAGQRRRTGQTGGNSVVQADGARGGTRAGVGRGQGLGRETEVDESLNPAEERLRTGDEGPGRITGTTSGANLAGKSRIEILQEVNRSLRVQTDPLSEQTLPRRLQDQARDYFRKFKDAKPD